MRADPYRSIWYFFVLIAFTLSSQSGFAAEGKRLFILSGQSNMRQPLPHAFNQCVEQVFGEDKVIVTTMAHPSQPIKKWYKSWQPPTGMDDPKPEDNGTLYDRLLQNLQKAIRDQPISSVTYIWMQGEADASSGWASVYEKSFLGVLEQLKQDLKIEDIDFVVGRINDFWLDPDKFPDGKLIREIQMKLGEENPNGAWINTDDLNRGVNPWGGYSLNDGHFPPPGYRVMGQRFAKAACRLIDPKMQLDEELFTEVFFESSQDVKSHGAIGKSVRVKNSRSTQDAQATKLEILTDGKFGKSTHKDPAWVRFADSEQAIELVLDLGEVTAVEAVGLNTLFTKLAEAEFPKSVTISISEDGENFSGHDSRYHNIKLNKNSRQEIMTRANPTESLLLLTEQTVHRSREPRAPARYIKFTIETGGQNVYIDEILVNPTM